jgi:hypothetical protein
MDQDAELARRAGDKAAIVICAICFFLLAVPLLRHWLF